MSGDVKVARKLIEEKAHLRSAELAAAESHLARLREGRPESIETTSLHLDVLRDLKRIHSHICSVAYPVLEAAGELEPSRLRNVEAAAGNLLPRGGTAASEGHESWPGLSRPSTSFVREDVDARDKPRMTLRQTSEPSSACSLSFTVF